MKKAEEIDEIIRETVIIDSANLEYCAKHTVINGFLLQSIRDCMLKYASDQCQKRDELLRISFKLIGEVIDNYEADAINLPAEMYNELKFHLKQLKKQIQ